MRNICKRFQFVAATLLTSVLLLSVVGWSGCKSSTLEPGGAYAPTNATGQVIYSDKELALADASYKLTYQMVQSVFNFEREYREAIWALSPDVKKALDVARPTAVDIDKRWAAARHAYKANPTPEGITRMQSILSEISRLLPVVQAQIEPVKNIKSGSAVNTPKP